MQNNMDEGGNIIRNVFGRSYKEAESIRIIATKGDLKFISPKGVNFRGKNGGVKFREYVAPLEEDRIINVNGHFYNKDGTFEGKINESDYEGSVDDVYVCDGKSTQKNNDGYDLLTYNNTKLLKENEVNITHKKFIISASTVYAESSIGYGIVDKYELFAIASVLKRNKIAYGVNAPAAIKFRKKKDEERNETNMIHAIAAEINVLQNGEDFSNGAIQWDGAEQSHLPKDEDSASNGTFMFKVNVMGWDITDELYEKWKLSVSSKFGSEYFNVPQKKYAVENYGGMKNKNKIRLQSTAQYGLTIFWREVNISKPKEDIK